uniref:Protein kinase domain-containing protein n=1 Tax=Arcella intermedia TaxID=1963864 RepID=A0A6B2L9F5_9EUKA
MDNEWLLSYSDLQRVAKLGSGVSSTVYKGTWSSKEVAIKILRLISPAKDLNDFKKELFIMSQVSDTNIVHFYGATLEPKLCIVMELCPNGSLYHYMVANEITWDNFFKWSCEMCSGINVLHRWKPTIVHRDLKSLNLLLNKDLTIKVCDFGLSRYVPPEGEKPQECDQTLQKLRGTYAYTAPEMYHSKIYTTKSDVFSIGIIIWEMSSCVINRQFRKPYSEYSDIKHDYQIIYQVAEQGRRPTIPVDCPKSVAAVMQQCWAQEPADRPSVEELLVHMNEIKKRYKKKKSRW